MPVKIDTDQEKQLTVFTVTGTPSFDEGMAVFKQFYEGKTTHNTLWDFRDASLVLVSSEQTEMMLDFIKQHSEKRAGGKTAIVAPADLEYGISRMAEMMSEIKYLSIKVKPFRSYEEAIEWVMK